MSVSDDNRPYINVSVLGKEIKGLLDSGANVTILGAGHDNFINIADLPRTRMNIAIRTADGSQHIIDEYVKVPFEFNGKRRTITVLVAPSIKKSPILGTDF